jgi:hypothetical protein
MVMNRQNPLPVNGGAKAVGVNVVGALGAETAPPPAEEFIWDDEVQGLAERRRGDARTWVLQMRVGGEPFGARSAMLRK